MNPRGTTGRANYVKLYAATNIIRAVAMFGIHLGRAVGYLDPIEPPHETLVVPSTRGNRTIQIRVYRNKAAQELTTGLSAVHFNWHGSGWILPLQGQNGALIRAIMNSPLLNDREYPVTFLDCSYALSPEHPSPADAEDGRDAYDYVVQHAEELRVDLDRITFSGFSAGGTVGLGLAVKLCAEQREAHITSNSTKPFTTFPVKGMTVLYPVVTWLGERVKVPQPWVKTWPGTGNPEFVDDMIIASHFFSPTLSSGLTPEQEEQRKDELRRRPEISPACAKTEDFPPIFNLYTAEYDHLHLRAEELRRRLVAEGKEVGGRIVKGVGHGWDLEVMKGQVGYEDRIDAYEDTIRMIAQVGGIIG